MFEERGNFWPATPPRRVGTVISSVNGSTARANPDAEGQFSSYSVASLLILVVEFPFQKKKLGDGNKSTGLTILNSNSPHCLEL